MDTERFGNGYVQLLNAYHTMPVLVASYGFSTARGAVSTEGPMNEQEQGERLVAAYEDFLSAGCAGAVVSTWQDPAVRSVLTDVAKKKGAEIRFADPGEITEISGSFSKYNR